MKNLKLRTAYNIFFALLGLFLIGLTLYQGIQSSRDWFSIVLGIVVLLSSSAGLYLIKKEKERQDKSK